VSDVSFGGLKINGQIICDDMPGKPRWHATSDYVPMYVGNNVDDVAFTKESIRENAKNKTLSK
jgi:hypothetical protein